MKAAPDLQYRALPGRIMRLKIEQFFGMDLLRFEESAASGFVDLQRGWGDGRRQQQRSRERGEWGIPRGFERRRWVRFGLDLLFEILDQGLQGFRSRLGWFVRGVPISIGSMHRGRQDHH